ncbi:MAG: hypothetical protein K5981_09225 [Clostridia bacterium]|nr:hypothetical protein [Clostridia bacterium]
MKKMSALLLTVVMLFSTVSTVYAGDLPLAEKVPALDYDIQAKELAILLFSDDWMIYDSENNIITESFYSTTEEMYNSGSYTTILDTFINMTAHAVKKEIVPGESKSISWIYEEEVGYEYVDELNHNFPDHNYFVYRVKLKYQYDSTNDIITNALPPQLLSLSLGVWYGDDPPYLTTSNKGFSISVDQQTVSYHMTMKGSISVVDPGFPQVIVYRYETTVYWSITI